MVPIVRYCLFEQVSKPFSNLFRMSRASDRPMAVSTAAGCSRTRAHASARHAERPSPRHGRKPEPDRTPPDGAPAFRSTAVNEAELSRLMEIGERDPNVTEQRAQARACQAVGAAVAAQEEMHRNVEGAARQAQLVLDGAQLKRDAPFFHCNLILDPLVGRRLRPRCL